MRDTKGDSSTLCSIKSRRREVQSARVLGGQQQQRKAKDETDDDDDDVLCVDPRACTYSTTGYAFRLDI